MLAAWTFASCGKETYEMNSPVSGEGQVTVSFTDEPNTTRTFFDPTSMIEVREKSLPSISLLCFDTDDSLTVRHKSESDTILRNDYYRVAVSLAGLTGQDVNATITVADWKTPTTQTIGIGA